MRDIENEYEKSECLGDKEKIRMWMREWGKEGEKERLSESIYKTKRDKLTETQREKEREGVRKEENK